MSGTSEGTARCNNFESYLALIPRLIGYVEPTYGQIEGELTVSQRYVYDTQVCTPLYGSYLLVNYDLDRYTRYIRPSEISPGSILLCF